MDERNTTISDNDGPTPVPVSQTVPLSPPTQAIGSKPSRLKKFFSTKFAIFAIFAIFGAFGIYKLAGSFASSGPQNGYLYFSNNSYSDSSLSKFEQTNGYPHKTYTIMRFNGTGDKVAYFGYPGAAYSNTASLIVANSDGSNYKVLYTAPSTSHLYTPQSISWSADGQWIALDQYDENDYSTKTLLVKSDGSESKVAALPYDQGIDGVRFSPTNSDQMTYLTQTSVCTFVMSSSAQTCKSLTLNGDPLFYSKQVADGSVQRRALSVFNTGFSISANYAYAIVERMIEVSYGENIGGGIILSQNIAKINISTGSTTLLTNYPESTDTTDPNDNIQSIELSPDGKSLLYDYVNYSENTQAVVENKLLMVSTDGGAITTLHDNLASSRYNSYISSPSWQPYQEGASRPPLPSPVSSTTPVVSAITMPPSLVYGTSITASASIMNPNLTSRSYTVKVRRSLSGVITEYAVNTTVEGGQTKSVPIATLTVPYAANGAATLPTGNSYAIAVVDNTTGVSTPYTNKVFALPMPPFTKTSPNATISKTKGNLITFSGKTLPGKVVKLYNNNKTTVLAKGTASSTGAYSFTFKADVNRKPKLCLAGYEIATLGCYSLSITIK